MLDHLPQDYDATRYRHWINVHGAGDANTSGGTKYCNGIEANGTNAANYTNGTGNGTNGINSTNGSFTRSNRSEDCFTIMTYNLLSQHYIWNQVYGYLDQNFLSWSDYRFPLINKTISQFQCDIMCFQEMECSVYNSYWSVGFPSPNYSSFYMKKLLPKYWADRPNEHIDGVGIFINTNRFTVLDKTMVNIGEYVKNRPQQYTMTNDMVTRLVSRNTVAIVLKLYDFISHRYVYVATTHLYWSPQFNDVKVLQTKILLNILEEFIDVPDPHIILMGDLNSNYQSTVFKLLDSDGADYHSINLSDYPEFDGLDYGRGNSLVTETNHIHNQFHLYNIFEEMLREKKMSFTSFTRSLTDVLDHMFINKDKFKIMRVLSGVDTNYCLDEKVLGFPNKQFPSDHIPLVAELCYI